MSRYTVCYLCVRGYRSFRQIEAASEQEAAAKLVTLASNAGEVTAVLPGL